MGVHELWSIIEPVRRSVPLYSLSGKTLAVDLSLWVCEAQHVQGMMGRVTKPHLRNLFFRVSSLTLMGVKLVFVMEGEAPILKAETMRKRTQGRFGGFKKAAAPKCSTSTNRGRFKAVLRECAEMLDYMGVPWVTAAGEAEAMCAYLDSQGLVDGCITDDGDAFLYGARTVYRNFNMNTKDPQVDCYQTSDLHKELHLSRDNLVGLAIFLGCDYIPKGIQGVGKEHTLRLIHALEGETLLQRFSKWKDDNTFIPEIPVKKVTHCNVCRHPGSVKAHEKGGCLLCDSKHFCEPQDFDYQCPCDWHRKEQSRQALFLETNIRKKTLANPLFPFIEIINEFLISKDKPVSNFKRRQPNMLLIQKFAYDKMEWPKHYTSEKVLVLMTYTNLMNKKYGKDVSVQIKPVRILKPRVRNGVSCFEVVWTTPEHYTFPEDQTPENQEEVRTIEEESLFHLAYPEVVESYRKDKALAEEQKKKKPKSKKEKTVEESDGVSDLLAQMTLQSYSSNAQTQPHKLPCTILKADQPGVVVLDTPLSHEKQQKDCPLALDKCSGSPSVSHAKSENAADLSVSAVISALHLSDIDWEAASFTSSPLPPATTSITVQPKPVPNAQTHVKKTENGTEETTTFKSAETILDSEQCYKEHPLRERVIMKNTAIQINGNDIVTKKGSKLSSAELGSSPSLISNVSHKYYNADLSGKMIKKTTKDHCGTNKANFESFTSKQISKTKNTCDVSPKVPQKYKFVKTTVASSHVTQRSHSYPGHSDKFKSKTEATKKSVCISVSLSSEDSDIENLQDLPQRKSKAKTKAKSRYLSDIPSKPVPAPKAVKPKAKMADKVVPKSVSHSIEFDTFSVTLENKCKDASPAINNDLFIRCMASAAVDSESDDSVIGSDSPLPLAERLRLKFQK